MFSQSGDPNPYFGHVIYAGRLDIDEPIAITRVNYVMKQDWNHRDAQHIYNPPRVKAPFTIVPFWNARGDAPVGIFTTGDQFLCGVPHIGPGADTGCVAMRWPFNWSSSDREGGLAHDYWHGTLLNGKRDGSGFQYMRNRYYDALTGRFTQEDPIGLAGGYNLYGFASGDAVNFSDPFGLCPPHDTYFGPGCPGYFTGLFALAGVAIGAFTGGAAGGTTGAVACAPAGPVAALCAGGLGSAGAAGGATTGGLLGSLVGAVVDYFASAGSSGGGNYTNRLSYAARKLGIDRNKAGEIVHCIKKAWGLRGDDNLIFDFETGDVLGTVGDLAGQVIGNLLDGC